MHKLDLDLEYEFGLPKSCCLERIFKGYEMHKIMYSVRLFEDIKCFALECERVKKIILKIEMDIRKGIKPYRGKNERKTKK